MYITTNCILTRVMSSAMYGETPQYQTFSILDYLNIRLSLFRIASISDFLYTWQPQYQTIYIQEGLNTRLSIYRTASISDFLYTGLPQYQTQSILDCLNIRLSLYLTSSISECPLNCTFCLVPRECSLEGFHCNVNWKMKKLNLCLSVFKIVCQ